MIDALLYLKRCWSRSLSHIDIPLSIWRNGAMAAMLLKLFEVNNYAIAGLVGFFIIVSLFLLGHLDQKYGVSDKEKKLDNKYN